MNTSYMLRLSEKFARFWISLFHLNRPCSFYFSTGVCKNILSDMSQTLLPITKQTGNPTKNRLHTLYKVILRIARNLLETRENIKIESHPFYHIICDWFSWGSSKKNFFFEKKIQNEFFKIANSQKLREVCFFDK